MKIAFILPSLVNKGPIVVAQAIVKHLLSQVDAIDVYYFDEIGGLEFPCPVYQITMDTPIDFSRYDIIHSHMFRPDKYVYKWQKQIKQAGVHTVTTIHQNIYLNVKYSHNTLIAWGLTYTWLPYIRSFDVAVPISEQLYLHYCKFLPNIVPHIYNGVDVQYNPSAANPEIVASIRTLRSNGFTVLGTFAAVTRRKGIDQLLCLIANRSDLALVIIGEGKEIQNLRKQAKRLNITPRVLFFPYQKEPYNYLCDVDIYAMPSREEGFGLAHVEAAFTHTPVVCSNLPVFHEIFGSEDVAFFELENVGDLSRAVDDCISKRDTYSDNAFAVVSTLFTGKAMSTNYLRLYQQLTTTLNQK